MSFLTKLSPKPLKTWHQCKNTYNQENIGVCWVIIKYSWMNLFTDNTDVVCKNSPL